jgi:hypothetical protein
MSSSPSRPLSCINQNQSEDVRLEVPRLPQQQDHHEEGQSMAMSIPEQGANSNGGGTFIERHNFCE